MNDYKIKRCPFCGEYPEVVDKNAGTPSFVSIFVIRCKNCGCYFEKNFGDTKEEIIKRWNNRYYEKNMPIIMVEDGSTDLEEIEKLGMRSLVYRQGARQPVILKIGENNEQN